MTQTPESILSAVFKKTAAGEQEVISRTLGLTAKQRRVLILIDGEKTVGALKALILSTDLLPAIESLESDGLIRSKQRPQAALARGIAEQIEISHPIQAETAKPVLDSIRLNAIKTLMIDSSETLLGIFGKNLVEKIKIIDDESQLNNAISQWNISLRESKKGQQHADQYLEAIKTLMK